MSDCMQPNNFLRQALLNCLPAAGHGSQCSRRCVVGSTVQDLCETRLRTLHSQRALYLYHWLVTSAHAYGLLSAKRAVHASWQFVPRQLILAKTAHSRLAHTPVRNAPPTSTNHNTLSAFSLEFVGALPSGCTTGFLMPARVLVLSTFFLSWAELCELLSPPAVAAAVQTVQCVGMEHVLAGALVVPCSGSSTMDVSVSALPSSTHVLHQQQHNAPGKHYCGMMPAHCQCLRRAPASGLCSVVHYMQALCWRRARLPGKPATMLAKHCLMIMLHNTLLRPGRRYCCCQGSATL